MKISCGIIVCFDNKVLLCHPTKGSVKNSLSFPKGGVEKSDNNCFKTTAIRECFEEVGIKFNKDSLTTQYIVDYNKADSKKILKRVYLFLAKISNLDEIGLNSIIIPKKQLQLKEVDWAGFLSKREAESKIFWRFAHLLDEILT